VGDIRHPPFIAAETERVSIVRDVNRNKDSQQLFFVIQQMFQELLLFLRRHFMYVRFFRTPTDLHSDTKPQKNSAEQLYGHV
jgi:hypothetical protein